MPTFEETGLNLPQDPTTEYTFTAWTAEDTAYSPYTFYTGASRAFTAQYDEIHSELLMKSIETQTANITPADTVAITYDANGGIGTCIENYTADDTITLPYPVDLDIANTSGKVFGGWYTEGEVDENSTRLSAGSDYIVPETATTLYAIWETDNSNFTAWRYNNANTYNEITGVQLSANGVQGKSWDYSNPLHYLVINPELSGHGGTVEITVPLGFEIDVNAATATYAQLTKKEFVKQIDQTENNAYSNDNTGTLTYTVASGLTNLDKPIVVPISADFDIWDKTLLDFNLSGDKPPVTVTVIESNASYTKSISKIYAEKQYFANNASGISIVTWYLNALVPLNIPYQQEYVHIRNMQGKWKSMQVEFLLPTDEHEKVPTGTVEVEPANLLGDMDDSDPSKITWQQEDCSISPSSVKILPTLTYSGEDFEANDQLLSTTNLKAISYTGAVVDITATRDVTIADPDNKLKLVDSKKTINYNYPVRVDAIDGYTNLLGAFTFENTSFQKLENMNVTATFDKNLRVNTYAVPLPSTDMVPVDLENLSSVDVKYTLEKNDDTGADDAIEQVMQVERQAVQSEESNAPTIVEIISAYNVKNSGDYEWKDYYITKVEYTIKTLSEDAALWNRSSMLVFKRSGTIYGTPINTGEVTLSVKDNDDKEIISETREFGTETADKSLVGRLEITNRESSVKAGEDATVNVSIQTDGQYVQDPKLHLVLPEKVRIESITADRGTGDSDLTPILKKMEEEAPNGDILYTVDFDKNANTDMSNLIINNDGLKSMPDPIVFTIKLHMDADISGQTINLSNRVFFSSEEVDIVESQGAATADIYNFSENNAYLVSQLYATAKNLTITEMEVSIDATATIPQLNIFNDDKGFDYKLTLTNNTTIPVMGDKFSYYTKVPDDVKLTGEATISGTAASDFEVEYTTEANITDDTVNDEGIIWSSTLPSDVESVTYMKVSLKNENESFGVGDDVKVSYPMEYTDNISLEDAEKEFEINSIGFIKKTLADDKISWAKEPEIKANFKLCYKESEEVTLTAGGGDTTVTFPTFKLIKDREFHVENIKTNNVTLVNNLTTTTDSTTINREYGITAQLGDNGIEYNLLDEELKLSIEKETTKPITFGLEAHTNITDYLTPRSVTVTFADTTESVFLEVEIVIEREPQEIIEVRTAITGGKIYQLFAGEDESPTITQNSAVSAQFAYKVTNPENVTHYTLEGTFPNGTAITLIDFSDTLPRYYYYVNNTTAQEINLNILEKFTEMGSDGAFTTPTATTNDAEANIKLSFIVDYENANLSSEENYNLKLSLGGKSVVEEESILTFNATSKRTFSTESVTTEMGTDNKVTGKVITTVGTGEDNVWSDKEISLKVTLTTGEFPQGTYLELNGEKYYPIDGAIYLPLGAVGAKDFAYTLHTPVEQFAEDNILKTALVRTDLPSSELVEANSTSFTVAEKRNYGVKLSMGTDDNNQLVPKGTETLPITFTYTEDMQNISMVLSIQEKNGTEYSINRNLITGASVGASAGTTLGGEVTIAMPENGTTTTVNLTLEPDTMTEGKTYRIRVRSQVLEDPVNDVINFVMVE